ncbi:MAG: DUF6427 family protein [Bacteroidota bacterium]
MFSFFKSNNPSVIVFYIFYLVLFRIYFAFVPIDSNFVFEYREPLSQLLFGFLKDVSFNPTVFSIVLSALLCFVQSLLVNSIVNGNKFLPRKSYISGALFILFASFFKQGLLFSPAAVALTFLLLSTERLFSLFKKEKPNTAIFDVGFFIAIATLFYFPSILFLFLAYIGLSTIRAFAYREWVIILIGFICPFFLVFTYYFWNDQAGKLIGDIANVHSVGWLQAVTFNRFDGVMLLSLSVLAIASLILLPSALYSSLIQVRKFSTLLVIFFFLIVISFALQQTISLSHLVMMGLPLGIISSLVIMQIKNKVVSEVIHLILILLVLAGQFLPLFNIF